MVTREAIRKNADGQTHASPPGEDSAPLHDLQVTGMQAHSGEHWLEGHMDLRYKVQTWGLSYEKEGQAIFN